jgi:hypothetical protein
VKLCKGDFFAIEGVYSYFLHHWIQIEKYGNTYLNTIIKFTVRSV